MFKQIAERVERLGPERDRPTGAGQRVEPSIQNAVGEKVARWLPIANRRAAYR
jgi:hypothetical protein